MQCRPFAANFLVLAIFTVLGTALLAQGVDALNNPEGVLFYSENNSFIYKADNWTNDLTATEMSLRNISGDAREYSAAWNNQRNETMVLTLDNFSDINFVVYNMSNQSAIFAVELTAIAPSATHRSGAVAYESISREGLVVWDNSTADTNMNYSIWNGTDLIAMGAMALPSGSATTSRVINLYPNPRTDDIMMVLNDGLSDISAILWNGSEWLGGVVATTNAAIPASRPVAEFAWYPNGDGILFFYNASIPQGVHYRNFTRSNVSWDFDIPVYNLGAAINSIDVCSHPNRTQMGIITIDSLSDLNAWVWDGTDNETNPAPASEDGAVQNVGRSAQCEFESSGNSIIFTFTDNGATTMDYFHYNISADNATRAWSAAALTATQTTGVVASAAINEIEMRRDPGSDAIMIAYRDAGWDVRTLIWNGTNISLPTANYIAETLSTGGGAGVAASPTFTFLWNALRSGPPAISAGINDSSNYTNPTNEGLLVNFTVNATDPEGNQYYLLVCNSTIGELDGNCYGQQVCKGNLANNGTIASCTVNTSGFTNQNHTWWGYVCDSNSVCSAMNNFSTPFEVNHAPTLLPNITPEGPNISTTNITCINGTNESDIGDTAITSYVWYIQNESSGNFIEISGQTSDHLINSYYDSNDRILCQVNASDNHGFASNFSNSSVVVIGNGTLIANATISSSTMNAYENVTISGNCTVELGDSENVTLVIEDNRTGTFTESNMSADFLWVNVSNYSIGRLSNTSSAQFTALVYSRTPGDYTLRIQCRANDTNVTLANSTDLAFSVSSFPITLNNPVNSTILDRDNVSASDNDSAVLNVSVPTYVPDGVLIAFVANLSVPAIGGQQNIYLGENTTINGEAWINYNPSSTIYAGNYTWWAYNTSGQSVNARYLSVYGRLHAEFLDSSANPSANYTLNETEVFEANVTSIGPESRDELAAEYNMSVNSTQENSTASSTVAMSYSSPNWNGTQAANNLLSVGIRNVSVTAGAGFWYENSTNRTTTIYSYMNITENTTSPSSIGLNDFATTTCKVRDQISNNPISGITVYFYRNATSLGTNVTNSSGDAQYSFSTGTYGLYTVTCNITSELSNYYFAGNAPEGNSSLLVTSTPPSIVQVLDNSNSTSPTNESSNITFTANATDAESQQWRIIICTGSEGITGTICDDTELCRSSLVNSGSIATCQHNTTGESSEQYYWWAYACDSADFCSAAENSSSPYDVNHVPNAAPTIAPTSPNIADSIICSANAGDLDFGDTVSNSYAWYLQNEGSGSYSTISGESSNQLDPGNFDSNDRVLCQVTPRDNHGFYGTAVNSSAVSISNGSLSAGAALGSAAVYRTYSTTLNLTCTVNGGDSASVTVTVEDNRTGIYAQSSTTPAAVYVNSSSIVLGSVSNTSLVTTVTVSTQTAGEYSFRAICQASDVNNTPASSAGQPLSVVLDTTPPVLSNIVADPTTTSAAISWDSDEGSTSEVDYGPTTALGSSVNNPSYTSNHDLVATSLNASTLYYYNVTSCNIDGYCTTNGPFSFTTLGSDDSANPVTGGYCTAVVVERRSSAADGEIGPGDIVEFYCELPNRVYERDDFTITVTNKDKQTQQKVQTPDPVYGTQVVLYP